MRETKLLPLINLTAITKTYQSGAGEFQALRGINLTLMQGEMVAIVGPSGSGKSTLMNIIGLLDQPTSGKYFFSAQDVSQTAKHDLANLRNHKLGFVFQTFFLLPRLTALQNVMMPLFYRGESKKTAQEKALLMLKKVGMEYFSQHKPNELSGGQQQRVAIARALVGDPNVILADEPTGALDSTTGKEILDLFTYLHQKEQRTIMIITHDHSVSSRCQRIIALKDGELI